MHKFDSVSQCFQRRTASASDTTARQTIFAERSAGPGNVVKAGTYRATLWDCSASRAWPVEVPWTLSTALVVYADPPVPR